MARFTKSYSGNSLSSLSPKQQTNLAATAVRLITNRTVCLSVVLTVCFLSLVASCSLIHFNTLQNGFREKARQELWPDFVRQPQRPYPAQRSRDVKWIKSQDTGDSRSKSNKILENQLENETNGKNSSEDYYIGDEKNEAEQDAIFDSRRQKLVDKISMFLEREKYRKHWYYRKQVEILPPQTKGVILLTNYRSGSTFLGELFNQHPGAFYVFEPLYPFTGGCQRLSDLKTKILNQFLRCDFPSYTDIYRKIKGPYRKSSVDMKCMIDGFCFRKHTPELCEKKLCVNYGNPRGCFRCGPIHPQLAMNACREKQMSVIKVIRYCDVINLKPILMDPNRDIKVVHLIRDPRGIESSRSKINKDWDMKENSRMTCDRMLHNGAWRNENNTNIKWLKDRYMKVRYEDLSLEPLSWAEKIYKFVGLQLTPEVKQWIKQNTHAQARSKVNPYATDRDSAVTMQAWRNHLSLEQVLTVQNECSEMMKFYGYKNVANQKELLDLQTLLIT